MVSGNELSNNLAPAMDTTSLCQECGLTFPSLRMMQDHKRVTGDEWVAKTLPPDPLHTCLLGPVNNVLSKMEVIYEEHMELFYRVNCLNKNGEAAGGKFNGPSLKTALNNLEQLEQMIPTEGFPFIEYLQSIKEVHKMSISDKFDENYQVLIDEFKSKFDILYDKFKINMTLKVHVIVDHFGDYFKETVKKFKFTNGEHHEAIQHTLKVFESKKKIHLKKKPRKSYSPG